MALNAQIQLSILAHETSNGDISRTLRATPVSYALSLADGTGANQAQVVWSDSRTATTSSESLSRTSLADVRDGAAVTVSIDALKVLYIRNTSAAVSLNVSATGWSALPSVAYQVRAGGVLLVTAPADAGYAAVGLGDSIVIRTPNGTATYDIVLIGEGSVA